MLFSYSAEWDAKLNKLLDTHSFTKIDKYRASLGDTRVWIANHPYASFLPCVEGRGDWGVAIEIRPSRATIARAHLKLDHDRFNSPTT